LGRFPLGIRFSLIMSISPLTWLAGLRAGRCAPALPGAGDPTSRPASRERQVPWKECSVWDVPGSSFITQHDRPERPGGPGHRQAPGAERWIGCPLRAELREPFWATGTASRETSRRIQTLPDPRTWDGSPLGAVASAGAAGDRHGGPGGIQDPVEAGLEFLEGLERCGPEIRIDPSAA
jgi:hypothetical protein